MMSPLPKKKQTAPLSLFLSFVLNGNQTVVDGAERSGERRKGIGLLERGRRNRSCQKTLILGAAQIVLWNGEATAHYVGYDMHGQPNWVKPGIHTQQNQQRQDHSTTLTSHGGRSKQPSLFLAGYIIAKM